MSQPPRHTSARLFVGGGAQATPNLGVVEDPHCQTVVRALLPEQGQDWFCGQTHGLQNGLHYHARQPYQLQAQELLLLQEAGAGSDDHGEIACCANASSRSG